MKKAICTVIVLATIAIVSTSALLATKSPINQYPGDSGGVTCVQIDLATTGVTVIPGWACADGSGNTYVCNNGFTICRQGGDQGYCPWAGPSMGCGVS